ncbi:hypothetical protein [Enterococcus faecalis]|uniref:hypothetical protein n=1 Tax=Enterococcus faecalis TaxID=1351 RepID=UPI001E340FEA|nr:hypothetical protein [Enterococcus faecalis]MCD4974270.1 hypothetical protein [Enterococcus faecalis]MCD5228624.1 hypothetical protein [Enterococcus faecalis]MCD5239803.1 hypothetical protein [Enterococcus faecalis]
MANIYLNIEADSAQELKEILSQLATDNVVEVTQSLNVPTAKIVEATEKALEKVAKKEPAKKKKATTKKKEEASTASTSDTEPSKTGEKVAPTETDSETEEVSATADLHPGATKADVQAAMKKAMANGNRDRIKMCFGRYNAEKLSDLKEEHYGKFITDLETLAGE